MQNERITILSNMEQYRRGLRYLEYEREDKRHVTIYFRRDESNILDKNAILALIKTDLRLEPLGYVANKEEDINPGDLMAADIVDWVEQNTKVGEDGYRFPEGIVLDVDKDDREYKIETQISIEDEKEKGKLLKLDIDPSKYPRTENLIKDFYQDRQGLLELRWDEEIYVSYEGENIGVLEEDNLETQVLNRLKSGDTVFASLDRVERELIILDLDISNELIIEEPSEEEILEVINKKVEEGIVSLEEALRRKKYLEEYDVTPIGIKRVFESYHKYPEEIKTKIPNPKILYIDNSGIVRRSVAYMNAGKNLLFEGERGVGKNVLTETLAWLYNRPLYEFPLNSQHSNSSIFGSQTFETDSRSSKIKDEYLKEAKELLEEAKNEGNIEKVEELLAKIESLHFLDMDERKLVFNKSAIIEAFQVGGVIVLDEFNTALAHVMTALNGLLDHRRRLYVPNYGTVKGHKNFIAIATQNKGYQGTFSLNEGTMDRFVPIIFPATVDIKSIIQTNVKQVDRKTLNICQRLFDGIKNAVMMGELEENALSVRGFIDACTVLEQGIDLKSALVDNIANRAVDLDDRRAIKEMIKLQVG